LNGSGIAGRKCAAAPAGSVKTTAKRMVLIKKKLLSALNKIPVMRSNKRLPINDNDFLK
jgi:hypothetical protein